MKKLLTVLSLVLSMTAFAGLDDFKVTGGNVDATFTADQVAKMLAEGDTCLKSGVKVLYHSKNITKKHCQKSKKLGLRTIKDSQLELSLYKQIIGFTK